MNVHQTQKNPIHIVSWKVHIPEGGVSPWESSTANKSRADAAAEIMTARRRTPALSFPCTSVEALHAREALSGAEPGLAGHAGGTDRAEVPVAWQRGRHASAEQRCEPGSSAAVQAIAIAIAIARRCRWQRELE